MSVRTDPIQTIDLTLGNDTADAMREHAMFLPSCSSFYVKTISGAHGNKRMPKGLVNGMDSLNYMLKDRGLFYYKYNLYSAGHAILDLEKSKKSESMIWNRSPGTLVLGDSGGYQIASGTGHVSFDWGDLKSDKSNNTRKLVLEWQEALCDAAMTLDVPTRAIGNAEKTGITSFQQCLDATLINLNYIANNRTGPEKCRFLNVLQGRTEEETDIWYDTVKDYDFEGWAFAGVHAYGLYTTLKRLIKLRDDGKLNRTQNWIHILGNTRLLNAGPFTQIQRAIRKHMNIPDFIVSYDSASSFLAVAKGQGYTGFTMSNSYSDVKKLIVKKGTESEVDDLFDFATGESIYERRVQSRSRFNYNMDAMPDDKMKKYVGSDVLDVRFPWQSPLAERILMSDICVSNDPKKKTSWDTFSYALIMCHNVYVQIRGVQEAIRIWDLPGEMCLGWMDLEAYEARETVKEILDLAFVSQTPFSDIEKRVLGVKRKLLNSFAGTTMGNKKTAEEESWNSMTGNDITIEEPELLAEIVDDRSENNNE
jgi:hypothetical protein